MSHLFFNLGKKLAFPDLYENLFSDSLNLGFILTCMIGYSVFYLPFAWYIEQVMPGIIFL